MPSSPTVRRRRLASLMKELREAAGRTREEAARHAGIAAITISRIETAKHGPKAADILTLARFYGLDDEQAEDLATLARQSRIKGWWNQHGEAIPRWFEVYVGLEEEVSELRSYQPEAVFGLFQTESYVRALMGSEFALAPEELDRRVSVRMRRQNRLVEADAPKIWIVLNEAVLRRKVGGAEVMKAQLEHLAELALSSNIVIQVLTFDAGAHPAVDGAFHILGFPEPFDPDVTYVQYRLGGIYLEELGQVREYAEVFNHLRARSLGPDESRTLILRIAAEMT
ncbi:helix-turn-helix transcriptional regulator [Actinocorallia aurantiaca]|uniref:Helix-turn-helix transcriptional regulator n=1 Tax=Actinocorallia aurantiaca TaxID=46204 RepID=A0ABN3TYG4_9ACTN